MGEMDERKGKRTAPPEPRVRAMVGDIVDRYDLVNGFLSLGLDGRWGPTPAAWRRGGPPAPPHPHLRAAGRAVLGPGAARGGAVGRQAGRLRFPAPLLGPDPPTGGGGRGARGGGFGGSHGKSAPGGGGHVFRRHS